MIKNKKNGFTLVELIATIALIAIVATIILFNLVGIKGNEDNRYAERFKKDVEEAACSYINRKENTKMREACLAGNRNNEIKDECNKITFNGNQCEISVKDLADPCIGLIDSDRTNPSTNKVVTAITDKVKITWEVKNSYKVQKCTFNN